MKSDKYGQLIFSELDICNLYLQNKEIKIENALVDKKIEFPYDLDLINTPHLIEYVDSDLSIEEFDEQKQSNWYMPQKYKDLDIALYVLDKCKTDEERQRVGEELLLFLERNLFPLLQYLVYLVDTMRTNNIVWGLGRGSSVASYVLYLIGVHKVNSMYYDLDISEFLK